MRPGLMRLCGRAGVCASLMLPGVMAGLTVRQIDFLHHVGWSPIGRTDTQWPSLLALGPGGWLMSTTFAASALLVGAEAVGTYVAARDRKGHLVGALIGVGAIGLAAVTFPADLPGATSTSWHSSIHDGLYPLIPLATIAAAALHGYGRPVGATRAHVRASRVLAPLMVAFIVGTGIDDVAQLSRYFAFATFAGWLAMIGVSLTRDAEGLEAVELEGVSTH